MKLLKYGQYRQVGADGVWRNKETDDKDRRYKLGAG